MYKLRNTNWYKHMTSVGIMINMKSYQAFINS